MREVLAVLQLQEQGHLTPHSLRVGCCSALFSHAVPPSMICLWQGWSLKSGTWREYARLIPRDEWVAGLFRHLLPNPEVLDFKEQLAEMREAMQL